MKNLKQEAKFIIDLDLTPGLLKILFGDRRGTSKERAKLERLKDEKGDNLYREAIYYLTNVNIEDKEEAVRVFNKINDHKKFLRDTLKRDAGLEVAALDYLKNIEKRIKHPAIIDSSKVTELARSAIYDFKTQTYGAHLLDADIDFEIERTNRYGSRFSLIFLDIDDFKMINDTWGHDAGDEVLIFVAGRLRENIRKADRIYRFGGDEFVILLQETDLNRAVSVARNIQDIISGKKLKKIGKTITLSMGLASFAVHKIFDRKKLLGSADRALYRAKELGKNRICVYRGKNIEEIPAESESKSVRIHEFRRKKINVKSIVHGLASGRIFKYRDVDSMHPEEYEISDNEIAGEMERIGRAIRKIKGDLANIKSSVDSKAGGKEGDLFKAYNMILSDKSLLAQIERELTERKVNGEGVIKDVFQRWENRFRSIDNRVFREKSNDIADIRIKIFEELRGIKINNLANIPKNSIIVAERLLPSDIVNLNRKNIKAIATREGSESCHSAILARALGIPFVIIKEEIKNIPDGTKAVLDSGKALILNPDDNDMKEFKEHSGRLRKVRRVKKESTVKRPLVLGDEEITVNANIATREDAMLAAKYNCDSVGLFRLEALYMNIDSQPDRDYLKEKMSAVLEPVSDKEITIRLLDAGSDRRLSYLDIPDRVNPALGLRGVRLLFRHPKLLREQIKAIADISRDFRIKVLVPMVSLADDIRLVRERFTKNVPGLFYIGAMIETPASLFSIDKIMKISDFISIGTNDLVQYSMAADREKGDVSYYFEKGNDIMIKPLGDIIKRAGDAGKECALCGEIAHNKKYIDKLLRAGLRNFSIAPDFIPGVRSKIGELVDKA